MPLSLTIDKLTCVRGPRVVFKGLVLAVEAGAMVAVEGPNGSGKSSLLRMIAGFIRPAAGEIILQHDGAPISDGEERAALVGWLGHLDAIKPQMAVREQVLFWSRLYTVARDPDEAMERFGLARLADVPGQYLSAGQRRRLALTRLWLSSRPLWLLDEPLAALDINGKALVARALEDHCAAGGIALAATHEPLGVSGVALRLGAA
jgi:heme exporter protein A